MTKVPEKSETAKTIGDYMAQAETVKEDLAVMILRAEYEGEENFLFDSHANLLPILFSGFLESKKCTEMPPQRRAQIFEDYQTLVYLLQDLDEKVRELDRKIAISLI